MYLSKVCINIKFDLEARLFSEIVQNCYYMSSETSANYQKCYTITVGDCVYKPAFSTALHFKDLCGFVDGLQIKVFMCSSLQRNALNLN
jgi:hypothetical protein